ncbi:hypothetical protein [Streptomyces vastus]
MPVAPPAFAFADPPAPEKARKDRRVLRAVLRWTAATVVFAAVGTSATYGITEMKRTDVPGLATESDGRWEYPVLTRPPLPSGSPAPFADENTAGAHHADLRELVLPAPKGAKADKALRGEDGWLATEDFLTEFPSEEDSKELRQLLTDNGLRHIAARGWTVPDGTHTRIYLLQFDTAAVAEKLRFRGFGYHNRPPFAVRGAEGSVLDAGFRAASQVDDVDRSAYVESEPYGAEQIRHAYLGAADTIALVIQSRKGTAKAVPFQQTVVLQAQLLG